MNPEIELMFDATIKGSLNMSEVVLAVRQAVKVIYNSDVDVLISEITLGKPNIVVCCRGFTLYGGQIEELRKRIMMAFEKFDTLTGAEVYYTNQVTEKAGWIVTNQ